MVQHTTKLNKVSKSKQRNVSKSRTLTKRKHKRNAKSIKGKASRTHKHKRKNTQHGSGWPKLIGFRRKNGKTSSSGLPTKPQIPHIEANKDIYPNFNEYTIPDDAKKILSKLFVSCDGQSYIHTITEKIRLDINYFDILLKNNTYTEKEIQEITQILHIYKNFSKLRLKLDGKEIKQENPFIKFHLLDENNIVKHKFKMPIKTIVTTCNPGGTNQHLSGNNIEKRLKSLDTFINSLIKQSNNNNIYELIILEKNQ